MASTGTSYRTTLLFNEAVSAPSEVITMDPRSALASATHPAARGATGTFRVLVTDEVGGAAEVVVRDLAEDHVATLSEHQQRH